MYLGQQPLMEADGQAAAVALVDVFLGPCSYFSTPAKPADAPVLQARQLSLQHVTDKHAAVCPANLGIQ